MRFRLLAVDYDGTLATEGEVSDRSVADLERLKASGRALVLATGRTWLDVRARFPRVDLFDRVVAENGATLVDPATGDERPLAEPPPGEFADALSASGVPVGVGRVIVATTEPHEKAVLDLIREQGLELQVIFNKGAVMVLPANVNKATGVRAALANLGISNHNMVGVGDAENDLGFLALCECSVAVANALRSVKRAADWVTRGENGDGVGEVVKALLADDLASVAADVKRHRIALGSLAPSNKSVGLHADGTRLLVSGSSRAGKSSLVLGLVEQIHAHGYQYCLLDPEGDYERLPDTINLGDANQAPSAEQVLEVLRDPFQNVCVSMLAVAGEHRPTYFARLLTALDTLAVGSGRPHWLIVDEAHHVLPRDVSTPTALSDFGSVVLVTLEPGRVSADAFGGINTVLALGKAPRRTLASASQLLGQSVRPTAPAGDLRKGEGVLWQVGKKRAHLLNLVRASLSRRRHRRKYTEGELPPERSFYFRGPSESLNLRAANLYEFLSLADGVDDATWLHHLTRGDYARWVEFSLKDRKLARELGRIAVAPYAEDAASSRAEVRKAIEARYAPPT